MKKMQKLIALTAVMALCAGQAQGQDYYDDNTSAAYSDSGRASIMSVALPVTALVVAAVLIATTDNHHHHHGRSSSSSSSSSSHSHSHYY